MRLEVHEQKQAPKQVAVFVARCVGLRTSFAEVSGLDHRKSRPRCACASKVLGGHDPLKVAAALDCLSSPASDRALGKGASSLAAKPEINSLNSA